MTPLAQVPKRMANLLRKWRRGMPKSDKLNKLLDEGPIKRGRGFTLSIEEQPSDSALVHKSTSAEVQKSTSALVHQTPETLRPSKGFKLRTDVADACKL